MISPYKPRMQTKLDSIDLAVAVVLGALLCYRAAAGAFHVFGISVASPIALATIAFLFVAQRAVRLARHTPPGKSGDYSRWSWCLPVLAAALCITLFQHVSTSPFLSDDYILVLRALRESILPRGVWFEAGGDGAYRPLGAYYFHFTAYIAGASPQLWRISSLLIHLFNSAMLFAICRKLWPQSLNLACVAVSLFLLHGTRPETVYWTAGSFDLLSCAFSLGAILLWMSSGRLPPRARWIGPSILMAAAILSKESAYATPFVGFGLIYASNAHERLAGRAFLLTGLATSSILIAQRLLLFQGPGGYIDAATGKPQILTLSVIPTLKALTSRIWEVMVLPVNWDAEPSWLLGAALLAYLVAFTIAVGRPVSGAKLSVLACFFVVSVLPAIHLALIGADLLGSRILYFPSVVFCVLCATVLRFDSPSSRIAVLVVIAASGIMLSGNLSQWQAASEMAGTLCRQVERDTLPKSEVPARWRGAYVFANGIDECVEMTRLERRRR